MLMPSSKCIPEARVKTAHDMLCVGIRICDIAVPYNFPRITVYKVIIRLHNYSTVRKKKTGHKEKLNERGMHLFRKNRFEVFFVILARFKQATGISLSEKARRRYIRKF